MRGLITWLALGGLVVGASGASAADTAALPATEANARYGEYAESLVNILETTESVDAFITTLRLLDKTRTVDRERLVPLIVRHAERVGIFSNNLGDDNGGPTAMAQLVMAFTMKFAKKIPAPAKKPIGQQDQKIVPAAGQALLKAPEAIPVSPWVSERQETSGSRTPILAPIPEDGPAPRCADEPDDAEVVRAMPHSGCGIPHVYEEFRDDIQVVTELLVDKVDPPRFFPMVGPAQLHRCHWKCTVRYTETIEGLAPFYFRMTQPRTEVLYIDKDRLHAWTPPTPETKPATQTSTFNFSMGFVH